MTTVGEQIAAADQAICRNIEALTEERALLSQNVLAHVRNLVEGAAVRLHAGTSDAEFSYSLTSPALKFVGSRANLRIVSRFHKLLQMSTSHYAMDGDSSERLMLKYYEHLHRIRALLADECEITVLANLEAFPIDLDPSLREYHEKISERIETNRHEVSGDEHRDRYYIHRIRPFFVSGHVYYEVTFYRAVNKVAAVEPRGVQA